LEGCYPRDQGSCRAVKLDKKKKRRKKEKYVVFCTPSRGIIQTPTWVI
jgi:hypothetical protein